MKILHTQIWRNLGVILWYCSCINYLIVVSFIRNFCVPESTTISNPPLSYGFIISLCRSLTEISINILGRTSFQFDYGLTTFTTSLETHDVLTLGWEIIRSKNLLSIVFYGITYWTNSHLFQCNFSIGGIFTLIYCPIIAKLHALLR